MEHASDTDPFAVEPLKKTAELLDRSERSVLHMIAAGELKAIRIGRAIKVVVESRRDFVRRRLQQQAGSAAP